MTLAAGLTPSGYTSPTLTEIVADINAQLLAKFPQLDVAPDQPMGQVIGIHAEKLAEVYEIVATLYNSLDPNSAEGRLLINIAAITGTVPKAATYSIVNATLNLNSGTTVLAGAVVYVNGQPQNRWVLIANATNPGPFTADIFNVFFRSENPGVFNANSGTLTQIAVSTPGWNSVRNALDSVPGSAPESDTQLRQRRAVELQGQGNGDIDAIRVHVERVPGVVSVNAIENNSNVMAADGTPAHSFHVIVWDGPTMAAPNAQIAQAIWNTKPSGIGSYGALAVYAVDSLGNNQIVNFDRATQVPIYIALTTTPATLTAAQTAAVKSSILAFAEGTVDGNGNVLIPANLTLGTSVIALALRASALIPGVVTDIPTFTLKAGAVPGPTDTGNITIFGTQISEVSTARITVNGV
jgi:uncharacterized phage protein gp47/JayE